LRPVRKKEVIQIGSFFFLEIFVAVVLVIVVFALLVGGSSSWKEGNSGKGFLLFLMAVGVVFWGGLCIKSLGSLSHPLIDRMQR